MRIYLDIETYRPEVKKAFIYEKVISIGVLKDWTPYDPSSLNQSIEPSLFTEWELGSEGESLRVFTKIS